jgi:hypothetical protein
LTSVAGAAVVGGFVVGSAHTLAVTPWTLDTIEAALRASWAADTCSPDDLARAGWHAGNPAWGQCDITALVVHDLLGGDLMLGDVRRGAERHGYHWWNRLASGVEIDLTRSQFVDGQEVVAARPVARPASPPQRRLKEYRLLRERVAARLGPLPGEGWTAPDPGP